jgi:hypothetical protein
MVMDFIERLTGIFPDGGSGWTEAVYAAVAIAICGLVVWRYWFHRRAKKR